VSEIKKIFIPLPSPPPPPSLSSDHTLFYPCHLGYGSSNFFKYGQIEYGATSLII